MKKVRLAMMVAAMFLGITTVARAQDAQQQGRGGRGGQMMAALFKDITLSDAQKADVEKIQAKYREQMQALRSEMQNGGDREALMKKNRELQGKQRDEIKAVLTDDQKKVFAKNAEEWQKQMEQRQQRPPSGI